MRSVKRTGQIIGALLLVQLAGLIVPFVLLHPVATGSQDWLANAAVASPQIKTAVFLLFANCALTVVISVATFRVFRLSGAALALLLLAASAVMFSLQAVDNAHILSMLSLSQQYTQAGGPVELFQTLASAAGSTRRWVHYSELLVIDCWIFLLYCLLYRAAQVPRILAAFGLITVLLHFTGIPLRGFLGYGLVTLMGVPMGLSHLAVALWLMVKGFNERRHTLRTEEPGVELAGA